MEKSTMDLEDKAAGFRRITIEPVVFFFFFAYSMSLSATGYMYQVKVCQYEGIETITGGLINDTALCFDLQNYADYGVPPELGESWLDKVQAEASDLTAIAVGIQIIPAAVSTFFIANAADYIGRKTLMLLPLIGFIFYNVSFMVNWSLSSASPWWMLIEALHEMVGGRPVINVATTLYISDITTHSSRTLRLNYVGLIELFCSAVGAMATSAILDWKLGPSKGFYGVYGISTALYVITAIWIIFFIRESKPPTEGSLSLATIFTTRNIRKCTRVVFKPRRERGLILTIVVMYFLIALQYIGTYQSGALFLYFQKLGWSFTQFTLLQGLQGGAVLVGCLTLVPLLVLCFKMSDMFIGVLAEMSHFVAILIYALCPYDNHWVAYLALPFLLLTGAVGTLAKSTLSKLVEPDEVPQVMAFLGMTLPFSAIAPPLAQVLYKSSLNFAACANINGEKDWCTATFLFASLAIIVILIISFAALWRVLTKIEKTKEIESK